MPSNAPRVRAASFASLAALLTATAACGSGASQGTSSGGGRAASSAGVGGSPAASSTGSAGASTGSAGAPSTGSGGASSTATVGSTSVSTGAGGGGPIGPAGGTLPKLTFAVVGDTRPPAEDDPGGYPTAVITKIWQDIEAATPHPAFAISTGDYMFASPSHLPGTQATQLALYATARAAFSNILFPAMGNHECDGATADNCHACGAGCANLGGTCIGGVCQTPNYVAFLSKLLAPAGQTLPYYAVHIDGPNNAWTSKFVFVACNAWSPTQATWLGAQLSTPTTYTFVVRHEGSIATTAPCLSGAGASNADTILSQHPYTLLIAGHTHTYAYYANQKEVIVGNGGAPLTGAVNYGYVLAEQQANGTIVFKAYDYATNAVTSTFTVQ